MCTYVASKVRYTRVVFCLKKQENSEGERVIEFDCSSMYICTRVAIKLFLLDSRILCFVCKKAVRSKE